MASKGTQRYKGGSRRWCYMARNSDSTNIHRVRYTTSEISLHISRKELYGIMSSWGKMPCSQFSSRYKGKIRVNCACFQQRIPVYNRRACYWSWSAKQHASSSLQLFTALWLSMSANFIKKQIFQPGNCRQRIAYTLKTGYMAEIPHRLFTMTC